MLQAEPLLGCLALGSALGCDVAPAPTVGLMLENGGDVAAEWVRTGDGPAACMGSAASMHSGCYLLALNLFMARRDRRGG